MRPQQWLPAAIYRIQRQTGNKIRCSAPGSSSRTIFCLILLYHLHTLLLMMILISESARSRRRAGSSLLSFKHRKKTHLFSDTSNDSLQYSIYFLFYRSSLRSSAISCKIFLNFSSLIFSIFSDLPDK